MISIVDYGLGNVQAIANIFKRLEVPAILARSAADLAKATHLILPGVGAFDWAIGRLNESGMRDTLDHLVLSEGCKVLGICVGMQMMARSSDEGTSVGLGWFDARVKLLGDMRTIGSVRLPHMGWNSIRHARADGLLANLHDDARFYFLHSYRFEPVDPSVILASSDYGGTFVCAARRNNIYGVQFHPEKSHGWGVQLLKNFSAL